MRLNRLTASFAGFREIVFRKGLNVIIADRALEATKTDSRNGLGKTTAVSLIDFCLGANASEQVKQMCGNDWCFSLSLTTKDEASLIVSRSPDSPSEVHISGDVTVAGIAESNELSPDGTVTITSRKWTTWLARECFERTGMPASPPSFRSLIRHLVRYRTDSLISPFQTIKNQRAEHGQAENSYLLNLDWRLAKEWADLKERKDRVALADDPGISIESRIAALEPQLVRLKRRAERLERDIANFSVLPEYRDIEARVQRSTAAIKELGNINFTDRQQLELYEAQANDESASSGISVESLFAEAGLVLGESVVRSLAEATEFQQQVKVNRRAYLAEETRRIRDRITTREAEQARLAAEHESDLQLLHSGGALEDFSALQKRLAESQVGVAQVEEQIHILRELSDLKSAIRSDESDLSSRTKLDVQERFELRAGIIARFGEIMEALYGEPASLLVSQGKTGVKFEVKLPKTGSGGVHLMSIFALDIAVSENLAEHDRGPGVLIHDSSVFADVDERQIAKAIEIAAMSSVTYGYQHIITMNSDNVPWNEFSDQALFDTSIILRLDDGSPEGSLLGQRLNRVTATQEV